MSLCLVAAFANGGRCASFQIAPDGNVIFEALGERMSLRLSDFAERLSYKEDVQYTPENCWDSVSPHLSEREKSELQLKPGLFGKGVLAHNPLAECHWNRIRADKPPADDGRVYLYTFFVGTVVENRIVFPGGVPIDEWPKSPIGQIPYEISFDLMAQDLGQTYLQGFDLAYRNTLGINPTRLFRRGEWPPRLCQPQATPGEIKAGFEDRGRVISPDKIYWDYNTHKEVVVKQSWNSSTQFFLPAEKRLGKATAPLCVICGKSLSDQECTIYLWSSDKAVRFEMRWWMRGEPIPSEVWIKADFAARKIARSIFIDRPEGDFQ